ncbi:hypothetical protein E3N88_21628 [Mikania micrantha]|uniref:HAT C-terminal dimerisation domain-containing protein n=1 Tax=Mikania micrantha TaxID=192012 RepID=A0A5N6N9P7_9ASTR|nr:hypothetical protein E3N88_21628 [Mikania micrantha]
MSNGVDKARCKGCGTFLKPESNSTLRSHLTKHCIVVKNNPANDQAQMSQECGVWNFDPDMVREKMGNLVIQESLTFNHFDNPRLTKMIQKAKGATTTQNVTKRARGTSASSELGRYLGTDWIFGLTPEEFENFDILAWWKQKETQFPILSAMARDLLSVQAYTVASESAFSLSGRVLSIRRTRLTPASLEMCICLKDHLDAMERVQDHILLESELDIEETIHDVEVEEGMTFPLSDEEQAMDEWMRTNSPELQSEAPSED